MPLASWSAGSKPGTRWVERSQAQYMENVTGRLTLQPAIPGLAGVDMWFCDFNEAHQFGLSDPGSGSVVGLSVAAESIPRISDTAGTTGNATAPNRNHLHYWGRAHIGAPTSLNFWGDRSGGIDAELHSSVKIGTGQNATGMVVFNPMVGIASSLGTLAKEWGFIAATRKPSGTVPTSGMFIGLNENVVFGVAPLTTAAVLQALADNRYFGFFIDTTGAISCVLAMDTTLISIATPFVQTTTFKQFEMRGYMTNNNAGTIGPDTYWDMYIDGFLIRNPGRIHTFEAIDIPSWGLLSGRLLNPTIAIARTAGAGTQPGVQADYMGFWNSRLVHTLAPF